MPIISLACTINLQTRKIQYFIYSTFQTLLHEEEHLKKQMTGSAIHRADVYVYVVCAMARKLSVIDGAS